MREDGALTRWLDTAVSGIRFKPDRAAVRAELEGHLEDKTADLRRIFPDIPEGEARTRALNGMGDPEKIRTELARVHRPWLGYLWAVSRIAAAVTLALALLLCGGGALLRWKDQVKLEQEDSGRKNTRTIWESYLAGVDPFGPDGPYPSQGGSDMLRTPLAALRPEDAVRVNGYRFRMERAGLFWFQDSTEDPGEWWLFGELRVLGPPWEPVSSDVLWQVRAVDSMGNEYPSSHQVYELKQEHGGYVLVNQSQGSRLEARFDLEVIGIAPGAEWIRLEYDRQGVQWSLTIPLEIEEG